MLLQVQALTGGYGEVDVFTGIDLDVQAGEIVALAGTNGSGKSSLVKGILGLLPRCRGSLRLDGAELLGRTVEQRVALGIGYVPQVANVFPSLTVYENLLVMAVPDQKRQVEKVFADFPALASRRRNRAGSLSGGERQQLAIARVLMARPRLLILDEPTANLSPALVQQVLSLIVRLPSPQTGVLLVEQRAREALRIAARGIIMDVGRVAAQGNAAALAADPELARRFLGH